MGDGPKKFRVKVEELCPECKGEGGTFETKVDEWTGYGGQKHVDLYTHREECKSCNGSGTKKTYSASGTVPDVKAFMADWVDEDED